MEAKGEFSSRESIGYQRFLKTALEKLFFALLPLLQLVHHIIHSFVAVKYQSPNRLKQ